MQQNNDMNKDNKKLVRLTVLPDKEIETATVGELTELRKMIERYDQLLARRIRVVLQE